MKTLILVDLQNDFVPGGALAAPGGDAVVPIANLVQPWFDLVVATQDWHPADHQSFAANHPGKIPGEIIDLDGSPQTLWPVHCVQNTPGADFVSGLDRSKWAAIIQKGIDRGIDSYSGFFDGGRRKTTGLGEYLKQRNVNEIHLMGLATDYCVKFTALDAVRLGFKTTLIEDGIRGINLQPGDADQAVMEMREAGVQTVRSDDLV